MPSANLSARGRGAALGGNSAQARSASIAKVLLLSTAAAANLLSKALATPLHFASQQLGGVLPLAVPDVALWSDSSELGTLRHGHEPEAPESTFQLVVDMVSIAVSHENLADYNVVRTRAPRCS